MLAKQLQGAALATIPQYIEDVFSTYLHSGSGTTTSLNVGVDLSTYGGLVWSKTRSGANSHGLIDTARGVNKQISTNLTAAQNATYTDRLTAFTTTGFTLGADASGGEWNQTGYTYVKWSFRKQAKFFDVVTYTGNGTNRTISHNLGSVPGTIIIKRTDTTAAWAVYHRSLANTEYLVLNTTAAKATGATYWNSTTPTSTEFSLGTATEVNASGGSATYVAYLFAHDAGGFGAAGTDNVISCGSFTTDAGGAASVTLNYEPQWVLLKKSSAGVEDWYLFDSMRGIATGGVDAQLNPNLSAAEASTFNYINLTATGFGVVNQSSSATYIYIAIRRGPMKTPTSGTSVFSPQTYTEIITNPTTLTTGWPTDLHLISRRTGTTTFYVADRLRGSVLGNENFLETSSTVAETDYSSSPPLFTSNTGIVITNLFNNTSGATDISYQFRRAPGFFDVVCHNSSNAANNVQNHNLTVVPELIIRKRRVSGSWAVYHKDLGKDAYLLLHTTDASTSLTNIWGTSGPTSTTYAFDDTGGGTGGVVAYLFATVTGVSKVGSYQGNGTSKTIDCGFTAGARFVLIKRTDSTGDWYVWDTARGIVSGNDPHLSLNTTAAEVTTDDTIDPDNSGFIVNQVTATNVNVNNASYIFLAVS